MTWTSASLLATAVALLALSGCGSDGTAEPGSGTGGVGGAMGGGSDAGTAGVGGSAVAGGFGGTSGSAGTGGGTGGTTTAGHCAPGVLHPQSTAWDGKLQRCYNYDATANGVTPDPTLGVHQLDLPEPMVAGTPYALSVAVNFRTAGQNIEFWGTSGNCGHADEQLYTGAIEEGVLCMDLHPTQAHQSILMIWRGQGSIEIGDLTICAHGACP